MRHDPRHVEGISNAEEKFILLDLIKSRDVF